MVVKYLADNDDLTKSLTHAQDMLKQAGKSSEAMLHRQELCELIRAWLIASYHVMDREVFPRLEELKASLEFTDSSAEAELFESTFGSLASLGELAGKLKALMDCHYSLLIPRKNQDS